MIRQHGPILRTAASISLGFIGIIALGNDPLPLPLSGAHGLWFLAGLLHMQLVEYAIHRFLLHGRIPGTLLLNHIHHHRTFHGDNFRTRTPADLASIPGRWWIFPVVGAGHYAILTLLFPPGAATVFLFACALHYGVFELTHWFTHLEGNAVDRVLGRIPVISTFWAREIEHHRIHHETPVQAFNFSFPYLGDLIAGGVPRQARKARDFLP